MNAHLVIFLSRTLMCGEAGGLSRASALARAVRGCGVGFPPGASQLAGPQKTSAFTS